MKRAKAINIITKIAAIILSIALVPVICSVPLSLTVYSMKEPPKIVSFISGLDYSSFVTENRAVSKMLESFNIDSALVNELMQTNTAKELIGLYANDINSAIEGKPAEPQLTVEAMTGILNNNMDEILYLAQKSTGNIIPKELLFGQITTAAHKAFPIVVEALPDVGEIQTMIESESIEVIKVVFDVKLAFLLFISALIISGGIYALRCRRFKGFLWLGIDMGIASVLLATLMFSLEPVLVNILSVDQSLAASIDYACFKKLIVAFIVMLVLCGLFIALYMILKKHITELPPQEPTPEEQEKYTI